ncbi:GTP-binding protein REM 1 [Stegostoma tigrinum]|uniref:GTP-binding protein REM 1 n=1 Tax=Stegostoma tigrinum TaxID=3053191 RepID=UPI00286FC8DC|nr:GTP-binding protein REM 1 [Stegostoma tigrinum]XP_048406089.2 GTP-binding protein REM 1 [Stegostoma tigrinum]XP_048406091.2 GTP-binding protein REM 1 [Stegostoma tigrinum]XP_048406093.2 GTP-binding protein REM 1 [Stegostoma tigrinum]XP_048406094.2 GTP-binding protein REM 1 [Stegostoma tigrinum]
MTLNTERSDRTLHRRASSPVPSAHRHHHPPVQPFRSLITETELLARPGPWQRPSFGHSVSYQPADRERGSWSSDSAESDASSNSGCGLFRVLVLGDSGVGKSSLTNIFAGIQDAHGEHSGEDTYERTLTVDGEDTTLIVMDTWGTEGDEPWVQDYCMQVGNAYIIVYSITDRSSFESASELRIQLRRIRQAENIPIILVGNKTDLVRCREVSVEEGRACAVVFDCKFIETSAALHHNVMELFEGIVRQIRLRKDTKEANERRMANHKRRESFTKRARRFLDKFVAKNNKKMALRARSKSCHDLSVL